MFSFFGGAGVKNGKTTLSKHSNVARSKAMDLVSFQLLPSLALWKHGVFCRPGKSLDVDD